MSTRMTRKLKRPLKRFRLPTIFFLIRKNAPNTTRWAPKPITPPPGPTHDYEEVFTSRGFADIFRDLFGGGGGQAYAGPVRGEDLAYSLEVDFLEAVRGGKRTITLEKEISCPACHGSGYEYAGQVCSDCGGRGVVEKKVDNVRMLINCPKCHGAGRLGQRSCRRCGGRGVCPRFRNPGSENTAGSGYRHQAAHDR